MAGESSKPRLDSRLVALGLAPSRAKAQALILAGQVYVDGRPATKAAAPVADGAEVTVKSQAHPYVSRGGLKLAHGLDHFGLDPSGLTCLDIGASTGGFTDCLLQRGAARVIAVDVGYGQLDWRLRNDERVRVLERTNARYLTEEQVGGEVDAVTADVSFISLTLVLPPALALLRPGGWLAALIKPQFEVGKGQVGKGGVVRDPALRRAAVDKITAWLAERSLNVLGVTPSPILGPKGNQEFVLCAIMPEKKAQTDAPD